MGNEDLVWAPSGGAGPADGKEPNHPQRLDVRMFLRPLPTVSVVMPVRNEEDFIDRAVTAVLEQDYPPDRLEVIVVDGMSTDGTRAKLNRLVTERRSVRVIDNPEKSVAPGLNRAIAEATGEIVVRVDGHCEISSDFVMRSVEALQRYGAVTTDGEGSASPTPCGVGGPIKTVGRTRIAAAIAAAMSSRFGVGGSTFRIGARTDREVGTVAFPAYTRETLRLVGPFDEELVRDQDDEYNFRLREFGGKIFFCPQIRSTYYSRSNLRSLWRQYFQYGVWKVRVMQKHPRQMSVRHLVPSAFVAAVIGLSLLALADRSAAAVLAVIVALYASISLIASVTLALRQRASLLPSLPLVFAILHSGYGSGFLWGLVRFARRWGDKTTLYRGERVTLRGQGQTNIDPMPGSK